MVNEPFIIESKLHYDNRGFFKELFKSTDLNTLNISTDYIQINHSKSNKSVIRGLHFQIPPKDQTKFITVIHGEIIDIIVDIRVGSPNFGKYRFEKLNSKNNKIFYIPSGFAHGFLALKNNTHVIYLTNNEYSSKHEIGINPMDLDINICWDKWLNPPYTISEKDQKLPFLKDINQTFRFQTE